MPLIAEQRQTSVHDVSPRREVGLWPVLATSAEEPVAWMWLSALVVLATVLRLVALNQQLWFDEIVTLLDSAREPIWRIVTQYGGRNQQHALFPSGPHFDPSVW